MALEAQGSNPCIHPYFPGKQFPGLFVFYERLDLKNYGEHVTLRIEIGKNSLRILSASEETDARRNENGKNPHQKTRNVRAA